MRSEFVSGSHSKRPLGTADVSLSLMSWMKHCTNLPSQRVVNHNFSTRGSVQSYDTTITFITVYGGRERECFELREERDEARWPAGSDVHWLHHPPLPWQKKTKREQGKNQTKQTYGQTVRTHKTFLPRQQAELSLT